MSLATLPPWGMTLGGDLYELPTPERPTVAPACSSLPTPTARDYKEQAIGWTWQRDGVTQEDTLPRALTALLPTPSANDTTGSETAEARAARSAGGPMLRDLPALLPTPTVMDMGANYTPEQWEAWKAEQKANHANGNGHGASLTQEAISLLPTPKAGDGERGRDLPRMREDTKSRELATAVGPLLSTPTVGDMKQARNSTATRHRIPPTGIHARDTLTDILVPIGASTPPPSPAGSAFSDAPHQPQLFPA